MKYVKTCEVKSPERANKDDSWIDFFIPNSDKEYIIIWIGKRLVLPLWIKAIIPKGYDLSLVWKSWLASKKWIDVLGWLIDNWYRGELSVILYNTGDEPALLVPWQKIVQGVLREVGLHPLIETTEEEFNAEAQTTRGGGGFGSTGLWLNNEKQWDEL